jgi:3-oxoadipyl-CoA thiolase
MRDVFICDAVRTPIGRFGGSLAKVRADDLAAVPDQGADGEASQSRLVAGR